MGTPSNAHRVGLCVSAFVCLIACERAVTPGVGEVRVRVRTVLVDPTSATPVVLLEEVDGTRTLPIWIGIDEARSIASQIDERALPRPNGHDIAKHLIGGLEAELERVIVTELRGGTFYALLRVETASKMLEIDARPSDAIAIALRTGAPIFVLESVFEESRGSADFEEPEIQL